VISVPAGKVQDAFFWVAAGVLTAVAFVYSGTELPTFPLYTVPMTFPRETIFFTLSAVAICFSLLRGGGTLKDNKQIAFYLLLGFVVWSLLASLWAVEPLRHSRKLIELVFFCGWTFALSTLVVPLKKASNLTLLLAFGGGAVGFAVALGSWGLGTSQHAWPFGNPNAAGMFCAFAAILNSGLLLINLREHKVKDQQVIMPAACLALTLMGLTLTFSKGALVGLIVGEAVLAWCFFPKWRKQVVIVTMAVLILGAGVYIIGKLGMEGPDDTRSWQQRLNDTTSGFRVEAYKAALKQIGGAPVGGRGLGTFYAYFPQYALPAISGHKKMGDTAFHAHSNILEIGTELGVVGMLIFIAFTVYIGVLPLLRKGREDTERNRLEAIWLAGFLMISAHALVAVHFYWTETVLYYWTAAGMLLALGRKGKPVEKVIRGLPFLAVAVVCLAGLWYVGVYRELLGRRYVWMRERRLKEVRKLDKKFERDQREVGRTRRSPKAVAEKAVAELQETQRKRFYLYSNIIAELNEELALVHDPRKRTDTYYQLGSAYYNIGGIVLHPSAPKGVFRQLGAIPWEKMKKRYGAAMYFFKLVVRDAPGYVNTDYFIGKTYRALLQNEKKLHSPQELGQFRHEEIKFLERYLSFNIRAKMSGGATKDLVRAYRGQPAKIAEVIERWLKDNPRKAKAGELTVDLAKAYGLQKKYAEGIMAINRHLELNPESPKKAELERVRKLLESRLRQKKPAQRKVKPRKQ
jgi:O-antigen ligase